MGLRTCTVLTTDMERAYHMYKHVPVDSRKCILVARYPRPALTVDAAIVAADKQKLLLIKRKHPPCQARLRKTC